MKKFLILTLPLFFMQMNTANADTKSTSTIYGKSIYPSDVLPAMNIYAHNITDGKTYRLKTKEGQEQYKLVLPAPANYIFYSWTTDKKDPVGAAYNECNGTDACTYKKPKMVTLKKGQVIKNFKIAGYYYFVDEADEVVPKPPKKYIALD